MGDGDIISCRRERLMEEVHVTVESDTVGARDDVDMRHQFVLQRAYGLAVFVRVAGYYSKIGSNRGAIFSAP